MNPAQVSLAVLGLPLEEARQLAEREGCVFRIGSLDGDVRLLDDMYLVNRITVRVTAGRVERASLG